MYLHNTCQLTRSSQSLLHLNIKLTMAILLANPCSRIKYGNVSEYWKPYLFCGVRFCIGVFTTPEISLILIFNLATITIPNQNLSVFLCYSSIDSIDDSLNVSVKEDKRLIIRIWPVISDSRVHSEDNPYQTLMFKLTATETIC